MKQGEDRVGTEWIWLCLHATCGYIKTSVTHDGLRGAVTSAGQCDGTLVATVCPLIGRAVL